MLSSNYIELTKKLVYNNRHGKFDLIDRIISQEKLLREKTSVLKLELALLLDIPAENFPAKAFKMWICRYRKRHAVVRLTNTQNKGKEYQNTVTRVTENKMTDDQKNQTAEINNNDDWRNFQPTDPDTLKKTGTEPLLAKVIPDKKQ